MYIGALLVWLGAAQNAAASPLFDIGGLELRSIAHDENVFLAAPGSTLRLRWSVSDGASIVRYRLNVQQENGAPRWENIGVGERRTIVDFTAPMQEGGWRAQLLACDVPEGIGALEQDSGNCPSEHFMITEPVFFRVLADTDAPLALPEPTFRFNPAFFRRGEQTTLSWSAPESSRTFFLRDWYRDVVDAVFELSPPESGTIVFGNTTDSAEWPTGNHRFTLRVCDAQEHCKIAERPFDYEIFPPETPEGNVPGRVLPLELLVNLRATYLGENVSRAAVAPESAIVLRWNVLNAERIVRYRVFGIGGERGWQNLDIGRNTDTLPIRAPVRAGTYTIVLLACDEPLGTDRVEPNRCPEGDFDQEQITLTVSVREPQFGLANLFVLPEGGTRVLDSVPAGAAIELRWDAVGAVQRYRLSIAPAGSFLWQNITTQSAAQTRFLSTAPSAPGSYTVALLGCDVRIGEAPQDPEDPNRCLPGHFKILMRDLEVVLPETARTTGTGLFSAIIRALLPY